MNIIDKPKKILVFLKIIERQIGVTSHVRSKTSNKCTPYRHWSISQDFSLNPPISSLSRKDENRSSWNHVKCIPQRIPQIHSSRPRLSRISRSSDLITFPKSSHISRPYPNDVRITCIEKDTTFHKIPTIDPRGSRFPQFLAPQKWLRRREDRLPASSLTTQKGKRGKEGGRSLTTYLPQ